MLLDWQFTIAFWKLISHMSALTPLHIFYPILILKNICFLRRHYRLAQLSEIIGVITPVVLVKGLSTFFLLKLCWYLWRTYSYIPIFIVIIILFVLISVNFWWTMQKTWAVESNSIFFNLVFSIFWKIRIINFIRGMRAVHSWSIGC